jgi:hypothetical protein
MTHPQQKEFNETFEKLKTGLLNLDPVYFIENNLTIDGKPFRLHGNGYKPFVDIYRYIGIKALEPDAKPCVFLKARQVGGTVMACCIELYFMASGFFGVNGKPPMRVMHAFPQLGLAYSFSKTKLSNMISSAMPEPRPLNARTKPKSVIEAKFDKTMSANDSLTLKQFENGNHLWIESTGLTGDRVRGRTVDALFFDECFPATQYIEIENGKRTIGSLYRDWRDGKTLPLVKTYNEKTKIFEYKKITNAWNRGVRPLVQINSGHRKIKCTDNHKFLTEEGWKQAKELQQGDLLATSVDTNLHIRSLNSDQLQIVLGSFLGDGCLAKHGNGKYRLQIIHGIKQSKYCAWKASMFQTSVTEVLENGYSKKPAVKFATKLFGIKELPSNKTHCPQWVLDKLDARGLAIWFMDDGSYNKGNANISTCSFDEDSQQRIVAKLQSLGIDCYYKSYFHINRNKSYFSILIN